LVLLQGICYDERSQERKITFSFFLKCGAMMQW